MLDATTSASLPLSAAPQSKIGAVLRATGGNFLEMYRLLPVRHLRRADRQGVLPYRNGVSRHVRRVRRLLGRRADASARRDLSRRLCRQHRSPQGADRHARDHGDRHRHHRGDARLCDDRRRGADHRRARPAVAGLFRRRGARRRIRLSRGDRDAGDEGVRHLVPVGEPADRRLRRRADRLCRQPDPAPPTRSRPGAGAFRS